MLLDLSSADDVSLDFKLVAKELTVLCIGETTTVMDADSQLEVTERF